MQQKLSPEAQEVLTIAKEVYQLFFAHWDRLPRNQLFIETYDAGWYQLQKALREANLGMDLVDDLKVRHDHLKKKILPLLYDYGIL
jgi:hypothetical protein